jgi:hypothetical protein
MGKTTADSLVKIAKTKNVVLATLSLNRLLFRYFRKKMKELMEKVNISVSFLPGIQETA